MLNDQFYYKGSLLCSSAIHTTSNSSFYIVWKRDSGNTLKCCYAADITTSQELKTTDQTFWTQL